MICPNCGSEQTTRFCQDCGAALSVEETLAVEPEAVEAGFEAVEPEVVEAEFAGEAETTEPQPFGAEAEGGSGFAADDAFQQATESGYKHVETAEDYSRPSTPVMPPMYDGSKRSQGLLSQAWKDVTSDPSVAKTVALLALIGMVPILNFVGMGYSMKWGKSAAFRTGDKLPESIVNKDHFCLGFYIFVVTLVWALIAVVLAVFLPLISWIAIILAVPFLALAPMYVAMLNDIGAGFRVKKLWATGKRNYGGLWLIIIVPTLIAGVVTSLLGSVGDLVGIGNTLVYSTGAVKYAVTTMSALDYFVIALTGYLTMVVSVLASLVCNRAMGYWVGRMSPEWVTESVAAGEDPR